MNHVFLGQSRSSAALRAAAIGFVVAAMALGSAVRIPLPFTPVPVTLQTAVVLLSALCLGERLTAAGLLSYLALGAAGVPLFAGASGGASALVGPTGGYLVGFAVAGFLLGRASRRLRPTLVATVAALLLADAVIFLFGAAWLAFWVGGGLPKVLLAGVVPFLPSELLKIGCVAAVYEVLRPRLPRLD